MNPRVLCFALLVFGLGARDAAAQVYKCRDSSGNVTYVDRPCPETEKTEETPPIDKAPTVYPDDNPPPRKRTSGRTTHSATSAPRPLCSGLGDLRTPDEDVINCARTRSLPYGRNWAMTQPWKGAADGSTMASGYCLSGVDMRSGERVVSMRRALFFRDDFREVSRGNQRYYVSATSAKGIYTSSFAEGAAQVCGNGG